MPGFLNGGDGGIGLRRNLRYRFGFRTLILLRGFDANRTSGAK